MTIEDSLEWHNLFVGQYSLGDFQFKGLINVNSMVGLYWKRSKNFAEIGSGTGIAHLENCDFVKSPSSLYAGTSIGDQGAGITLLPAGPFTFLMRNVTYVGSGGAMIQMGQHCGIFGYNFNVPGSGCNVNYILENVVSVCLLVGSHS